MTIEVSLCDFERGILIKKQFKEDDIAIIDIKNARIMVADSNMGGMRYESQTAINLYLKEHEYFKLEKEIKELKEKLGKEIDDYYSNFKFNPTNGM